MVALFLVNVAQGYRSYSLETDQIVVMFVVFNYYSVMVYVLWVFVRQKSVEIGKIELDMGKGDEGLRVESGGWESGDKEKAKILEKKRGDTFSENSGDEQNENNK